MTLAQAGTMLRMTTPIGLEAQRPNPALEPLAPLLGDWRTTGAAAGRLAYDWDASAGAGDDLPWPYVVHRARGRRLRIDAL
jgi:hypothetical protein